MMPHIFLSRRNLESLLNKLDRNKVAGPGSSLATIIKCDNQHPKYPQTMPEVRVTAVEDEDYYTHREAGEVHPLDDPKAKKPEVRKVAVWPFPIPKNK